jgi:hypothetical protein
MTEKTIPGCPTCAACSTVDSRVTYYNENGGYTGVGDNPRYWLNSAKWTVRCTICDEVRIDLFFDVDTTSVKVLDKR